MVDAILSGGDFGGEIVRGVNVGETIEKLGEDGSVWSYLVTNSKNGEGLHIATFAGWKPKG